MNTAADKARKFETEIVLPALPRDKLLSGSRVELSDNGLDIVSFHPFLPEDLAQALFERLIHGSPWHRVRYSKYGKQFQTPRYTTVFGADKPNPGANYNYPLSPIPSGLKNLIETVSEVAENQFNFMLFNLYIDNSQSISFHSDDESFLGPMPTIGSLSLGAPRKFQLRKKSDHKMKHQIVLESGDLLIMRGPTQHEWEHGVPKTRQTRGPRINITFRKAINPAGTNNYYRYNRYGDDYQLFKFRNGTMVSL